LDIPARDTVSENASPPPHQLRPGRRETGHEAGRPGPDLRTLTIQKRVPRPNTDYARPEKRLGPTLHKSALNRIQRRQARASRCWHVLVNLLPEDGH
jgi:hypothetical protein